MMRIILKIISVSGLLFLIICLFGLGTMPLIEGKHLLDKYIDTQFAKNYTPKKFEQIKTGMELNTVIDLIGDPLYSKNSYRDSVNINYYYTRDGKLKTQDNRLYSHGDFAWYRSRVEVNNENIVVNVDKGWNYD